MHPVLPFYITSVAVIHYRNSFSHGTKYFIFTWMRGVLIEDVGSLNNFKIAVNKGTVKFSITSRFKISCPWFSRYHCSFSYFSHYFKNLMEDVIEFGFYLLFLCLTCKLLSCFLIFLSLCAQSFLTVYSVLSFNESFPAPLLFLLIESVMAFIWPRNKILLH